MCLKGHIFFLYLSHFLLQDSCKFPSNFLVQYRAEFPIEFTLSAIHVALTFPGITHMMKIIWISFGISNLRSPGNFNFPYLFLICFTGNVCYSMCCTDDISCTCIECSSDVVLGCDKCTCTEWTRLLHQIS